MRGTYKIGLRPTRAALGDSLEEQKEAIKDLRAQKASLEAEIKALKKRKR